MRRHDVRICPHAVLQLRPLFLSQLCIKVCREGHTCFLLPISLARIALPPLPRAYTLPPIPPPPHSPLPPIPPPPPLTPLPLSPSLSPVAKILEVGALPEGQEVVAIGTLYKDMKLKPSIMDEYAKDKCVGGEGGQAGGAG